MQYFPKTEKYVPLFSGVDDSETVDNRNRMRKQIDAKLIAAAESGKELEGFISTLFNDIKMTFFLSELINILLIQVFDGKEELFGNIIQKNGLKMLLQ